MQRASRAIRSVSAAAKSVVQAPVAPLRSEAASGAPVMDYLISDDVAQVLKLQEDFQRRFGSQYVVSRSSVDADKGVWSL
jgi:hypothetical protein